MEKGTSITFEGTINWKTRAKSEIKRTREDF